MQIDTGAPPALPPLPRNALILRQLLEIYADGDDPDPSLFDPGAVRPPQKKLPDYRGEHVKAPDFPLKDALKTTLTAPPSTLAVYALRGSLVVFEPMTPLQYQKTAEDLAQAN